MPHGDDPDGPPDDAVEKPVWAHDELAIRKLREFGKDATGSRKSRQPAQPRFGSLLEPLGGWDRHERCATVTHPPAGDRPRQNFVEVVTLRSGNLALAPCEQSENLPLMLGALFLPARGDV